MRVILGYLDRGGRLQAEEVLDEMERLVETLGGEVVARVVQRRKFPHPAYYFGKGKLKEIAEAAKRWNATHLIVDGELTPSQAKNIEDITGLKVMDRTQLILDIFAKHADTEESKLQVELAQLRYILPKLVGQGVDLSRLGGGIGTRGPGETKLEVERRKIKRRIAVIKKALEDIAKDREVRRKERKKNTKTVSIVGYTNAGKSTLLKALTGDEDVYVADKLFATLSPTLRRVRLPSGRTVVFADTVGFIRRLPHTLVEAFHSTLEEVCQSDLALIVLDASDPGFQDKLRVVKGVLREIGAENVPKLIVFNKIDLLTPDELEELKRMYPDAVFISAKDGVGLDELLKRVDEILFGDRVRMEIKVPFDRVGLVWSMKDKIQVLSENPQEDGILFEIEGSKEDVAILLGRLDKRD